MVHHLEIVNALGQKYNFVDNFVTCVGTEVY